MKYLVKLLKSIDVEVKTLNKILVKLQWLIVGVNVINVLTIILIFWMIIL